MLVNFFSSMCPQIRLIKSKIMIQWLLFYLEILGILNKIKLLLLGMSIVSGYSKSNGWISWLFFFFSVCLQHLCLPSIRAQFKAVDLFRYDKLILILMFRELTPKEYFPTFSTSNINSLNLIHVIKCISEYETLFLEDFMIRLITL